MLVKERQVAKVVREEKAEEIKQQDPQELNKRVTSSDKDIRDKQDQLTKPTEPIGLIY